MARGTAEQSAGGSIATAWSRWTTRRWLSVGVAGSLTVLLVLGLLGFWALDRASSVTDTLVNHSSPALTTAVRLESAMLDQETGIRGYGLSGQSSFLDPYTEGMADEKAAVTKLRTLTAGDAKAAADLDTVLARIRTWQTDFAAPVAAAPPGAPVELAAQRSDQGKNDFDAIRAAAAVQQTHLQAARNTAAQQLQTAQRQSNWVFSAVALVILLLSALVVTALRRGVTAPLERLQRDVREVGAGEFSHAVSATTGPADLRLLAEDVERMRRRLADELAFSDQARARLDEQAEELRRSNGELEQFAYVASHDLQEPLRKVASFCQLLQRRYADKLDERADQYIAFAVDGANRMQTLINDLLAFSRVGRMHQEYAPVDLEQVFTATVDALSIAVEESGAVITHDPLPVLTADRTQIGMLFQNLIGNAIKFRAPDRAPEVRLSAVRDGDRWQFAVQDNGIGIGTEFADRVFVIFQRLHTKEAYPGNGIGLAMCKKIVEFHGGTIAVDPDTDSGTRISFTLPLAPAVPVADPGEPERTEVVA
ncbi:sensor histidine kinase [Streptacidiphilus jeojiensis]|uniref:sensor histidine kinase n=1 Tax=Streptacidiphilus jeojiensis TaxID=3229225 RepID=UPI0036D3D438